MKPPFYAISEVEFRLSIPGFRTKQHGSVWTAYNDESNITVTMMSRQDFRTSWGVMYTEIDGGVIAKTGLTQPHKDDSLAVAAINATLAKMTKDWVAPLPAS